MNEKITEKLLVVAEKISSNRYMVAIRDGFAAIMPLTMVGAFSVLFINIVCAVDTTGMSLAKLPGMAWLNVLSPLFEASNYATMNFLTIVAVVSIAHSLGKQYGHNEIHVPLVALSSYVTLCSTKVLATIGEESVEVLNVLSKDFTAATGLFVGMLTAIVATELYIRLVDSGKMEIKMPDSVPSSISKSFAVLFPVMVIIFVMSGCGLLFESLTGITISQGISMAIQKPLTGILTGLPGFLLICFLSQLLWIFGIHGTNVLSPVYTPILTAALAENLDAAALGQAVPNIITRSFMDCYMVPTGAGITGGLILAIFIFSKKSDYKTIAKLSLVPGVFNVNEPMIFGLPIVLNPIIAIPFMLAPLIVCGFAYFMTYIGFAAKLAYQAPWTTPIGLGAFIASGGDIGATITQVLCLVISFAIYIPFVLMANKHIKSQEKSQD